MGDYLAVVQFVCSVRKLVQIYRYELNNLIGTTDVRVALFSCFYSAIFQLTRANFQTFAYVTRERLGLAV